jgi:two-component system, OmpR family, response regulator CpxR
VRRTDDNALSFATFFVLKGRSSPAHSPTQMAATILCVDDDIQALDLRARVLEQVGYRVLSAHSATQALEAFRSGSIDAVILDYWLPGSNGIKVATEFKSLKPHIPIVMLSGSETILDEVVGRVDRWLVKGNIEPKDLLSTLDDLLSRRTAR